MTPAGRSQLPRVFSGWLEVERLQSGSFRHVRQALLRWFQTYGVPEELATDGGPPFNSHEYDAFLRTWTVDKCLSSAYYAQSNGRAEAAVKSAKRILLGNIDPITGMLDTDSAARAIMAHRNTPTQDTGIAPSVMLFGRPLRDHLPRSKPELRPEWRAIAECREKALAKRALRPVAVDRELDPLQVGDCVQIQNQAGNHPNKWYNTGVISEVLPYRQYRVIVDGSRRISLRNRRFLKRIVPVSRKQFGLTPELTQVETPTFQPEGPVRDTTILPATGSEDAIRNTDVELPTVDETSPPSPPPEANPGGLSEASEPLQLRRGTRSRVQRKMFVARLTGKTHE